MGVSSTRVGDHRGSARTVQYLSKNHMMVSGLRSARSGALPHLAVFAAERCVSPLSPVSSLSRLSIISLSISSRLVILGWQWSASPGVVRFHPGLSSFQEIQTLLKLSLSLFHYLISPFPAPNDEAAGREERDLGGIYCTVKPGWKRRIPSDLRS